MTSLPRLIAGAILFTGLSLTAIPMSATPALASGHGGEEEKAPESPYIQLDDLNVTIFEDRRARGIMTVALSLEVTEVDKHGEVTARQPLLQNAYFQAMTRYAGMQTDIDKPLNIPQISAMLQRQTDKVLGGSFAKVLVSAAAIRKM